VNKIAIFGKKSQTSHFLTIFDEKISFLLKNLKKWTFLKKSFNIFTLKNDQKGDYILKKGYGVEVSKRGIITSLPYRVILVNFQKNRKSAIFWDAL
jgi:hypothetical protein